MNKKIIEKVLIYENSTIETALKKLNKYEYDSQRSI